MLERIRLRLIQLLRTQEDRDLEAAELQRIGHCLVCGKCICWWHEAVATGRRDRIEVTCSMHAELREN